MERHDTHALSSNTSSSGNHSYEFENKNKNKNNRKSYPKNIPVNLNGESTELNEQIDKINSILNKYNIHSEQTQKNNKIIKSRNNKEEKEIKIENLKNLLNNKNFSGDNIISNIKDKDTDDIYNINNKYNIFNSNKDKDDELAKEKRDIKRASINSINNNKINSQNKNDINIFNNVNKDKENQFKKGKLIYSMIYKNNKETRFNNIQKVIDEENKKKLKLKKLNDKDKLLLYQQVYKSGNLLREIKKPGKSFITKIFKEIKGIYQNNINMNSSNIDKIPNLLLTAKNDRFFCTKQSMSIKEYNRELKFQKYKKYKKDIDNEKIPSFSSINTSSSNSYISKSKNKSKSKKKTKKEKSKNTKNISLKKSGLYYKRYKPQKSISIISKLSKEKNEDEKKLSKKKKNLKIFNIKKKKNNTKEEKLKGINRNIRKYNIMNKNNEKFNEIQDEINKFNENEKYNNKEREDFKKFLQAQRMKRNKQIMKYMKKNGINSYNFFYPKEPSPLLGTFKDKYNIYPTLNMERKNSVDVGPNNNIIINTRQFYKVKYNLKKHSSKNNNQSKEYNHIHEHDIEHDNNENNNDIYIFDKHYGLEKDCPLCRAFQMKKLLDQNNTMNFIKSMKYKKLKLNDKNMSMVGFSSNRLLSPNSFSLINLNGKDYTNLSRNRNSSAREGEYIDVYPSIRKNIFLNEYFNH